MTIKCSHTYVPIEFVGGASILVPGPGPNQTTGRIEWGTTLGRCNAIRATKLYCPKCGDIHIIDHRGGIANADSKS